MDARVASALAELAATRPRAAVDPIRVTAGGALPPRRAASAGKANPGESTAGEGEFEDDAVGARTAAAQPFDDDAPWPDEAAEEAMMAERAARENAAPAADVPRRVREAMERVDPGSLPRLDDLVATLPGEVRATLEELFRARFVTVAKAPPATLKQ